MIPETARATCGDDVSLFEYAQGGLGPDERRAVEAHVNRCADCRRVLAEALHGLGERGGDDVAEAESRRRIGRYTLVELLGAGASGVVYRAFDPELERTVALKLLRADASDTSQESRERRLREARTMAQVSDPHVVTVFDAGLSGGAVYIVMEYVEGGTLEEWRARAPRALREIVGAFTAAGRGLSALHARALVHRDFKPENVMIGGDGRIQVTDFGLARAMSSVEAASGRTFAAPGSGVTLTQGLFGTPAYMAPELFAGKPADARSDQFSFAVALLTAVTGHHPFGADERISVSELVLRIHRDQGDLARQAASLPGPLREALVRALSVEPARRFPSMDALLSELEGMPDPGRRRTWRGGTGALLAALLLVGGALAFFRAPSRTTENETPSNAGAAVISPPPPEAPTEAHSNPVTTVTHEWAPPEEIRPPAAGARSPARVLKAPARADGRRPSPSPPAPNESRYDDRLKDPFR